MNMRTHTQTHTWAGILLVLATGLIHGVEGPANYHEAASKGYSSSSTLPGPWCRRGASLAARRCGAGHSACCSAPGP